MINSTIEQNHTIDLSECLSDITSNIIFDSEYSNFPADIFEEVVFQALNDLIDDFAFDPYKYLQSHHLTTIDRIADQYLNS